MWTILLISHLLKHSSPIGFVNAEINKVFALICEGVPPTSIVVQSPYIAQVQLLRDRLEEYLVASEVEVSTIDSFQGREADAVVISMVRSFSYAFMFFVR